MQTKAVVTAPEAVEADVLLFVGFEKDNGASPLSQSAAALTGPAAQWFSDIYASGEFTGKPYEFAVLHNPSGVKAKRIALLGGGKSAAFGAPESRRLASFAVRHFR